ncbi:MAG: succinate dehydrogenase, cytochrome b556 subunit [Zoogloeaceae bacterium]|jgi:succinate dehydrogenase / fumarate reductase cytochrome b subunit|nr:succinate dehydrogenase, cytochrome b556 subunit [Zoogloeaceae bacterium]
MAELVKTRPKFLNLFEIKLPLPGWASILHRVSGAGLFLMLPLLIWLFGLSLGSQDAFDSFKSIMDCWLVKLILTGLLWAYLHHFCMGVRILLIDRHIGIEKAQARASTIAVLTVSLVLTLVLGVQLW